MVVFLAFCCHTVVWGLIYTIGIWTSTFEEAFGASKTVASTVGSGLTGINYIAGNFNITVQTKLNCLAMSTLPCATYSWVPNKRVCRIK